MTGQNDLVLKHLTAVGCITSWEAIESYHITRLSSIIYRLKAKGYRIEDEWCQNMIDGRMYKRYWLRGEE